MKKYQIEKVLHEVIRDMPEARKIESMLERGIITPLSALKEIVQVWDSEIERVASEINENWKI